MNTFKFLTGFGEGVQTYYYNLDNIVSIEPDGVEYYQKKIQRIVIKFTDRTILTLDKVKDKHVCDSILKWFNENNNCINQEENVTQ
jgi:hypothetical protein